MGSIRRFDISNSGNLSGGFAERVIPILRFVGMAQTASLYMIIKPFTSPETTLSPLKASFESGGGGSGRWRLFASGLMLLGLSACAGSSGPDDYAGQGAPVRQVGKAGVVTPVLTLPEKVEELSNRMVQVDEVQRNVATDMDRRLGLLEKEIANLRGSVDEAMHENQQLRAQLEAKSQEASKIENQVSRTDSEGIIDTSEYTEAQPTAGTEPVQTEVGATTKPPVTTKPPAAAVMPPPSVGTTKPPANPKQAYDEAFLLLKGGRYPESLEAFNNFLKWFPNESLADNAQYWVGELFYVQRKFPEALVAFNQVLVRWPASPKIPASLLKIGFSFFELNDMENAKSSLSRLVSDYPSSPAVAMAKQRLAMVEERLKGR